MNLLLTLELSMLPVHHLLVILEYEHEQLVLNFSQLWTIQDSKRVLVRSF
jgi:hypothetical protein